MENRKTGIKRFLSQEKESYGWDTVPPVDVSYGTVDYVEYPSHIEGDSQVLKKLDESLSLFKKKYNIQ